MKKNLPHSVSAEKGPEGRLGSVRVRDLATRIFHRLLVVSVTVSFIAGKIGCTGMLGQQILPRG